MKWFQHDSDASHDAKVKKLILKHGAIGYAVYFHCLELIAGNLSLSNITFELEHDAEIIADNLKITGDNNIAGIDKVNNILKYIIELGLFQMQNNRVFCFKMANRLDNTVSRSPEINKIKQLRSDYVESTKKLGAEENTIHDMTIHDITTDNNKDDKSSVTTNNETTNKTTSLKAKKESTIFVKPSLQEIQSYLKEINKESSVTPESWLDHYEANGWMVGRNKMKSWKAAVRLWVRNAEKWAGEKKTKLPFETPLHKALRHYKVPEDILHKAYLYCQNNGLKKETDLNWETVALIKERIK